MELKTMKRIVIKVDMTGKRSRSKALTIVGGLPGVGSVSFAGQESNHIVVIGQGIDPVKVTKLLRRKVGPSELVSVGPVEYGGDGYGYGYGYGNGTMVPAPAGEYYSHPYAYGSGPGHGYLTTTHNPYVYGSGPGHGYLTTSHNPYSYGQGYVYEDHNPSTCSIM